MPNQHVVPRGSGWAVKGEGNSRATAITSTKQEAIDKARNIEASGMIVGECPAPD